MSLHAKMTCFPLLEKLEGDEQIPSITPVIDAQFFIGKGWDATLRLLQPDISDKHCTIEKIELEKWTVVAHDNDLIEINNLRLPQGLPRILKFGDLLRISSSISFQFKCSCMNSDNTSSDNIPVVKRQKLSPVTYSLSESGSPSCFQIPDGENLKSRYEQLLNENVSLSTRLKKAEDVAVFLENEKFRTETLYYNVMQNYKSIGEKYSQLRRLKEESDRNQNSDMKSLRDTVSTQKSIIERLQLQYNQLQQDFYTGERFKHNLEGQNKQLITDNAVLHLRVEKVLEFAKMLRGENVNLQTEVNDLKKKKDDLQKELDGKANNFPNLPVGASLEESKKLSEDSNSNVQNSLTELLETEFKCSICDEVFIEAVVTNCTHIFCSYCIKSWKSIKPNCPICRTILTREIKVLTIDSFLSSIMSLVTENLRINWLKISEERKALKETAVTQPIEFVGLPVHPVHPSSTSSSSSENVGNFHHALMNVYRHLMHYDDVIDLTNDRIYGL